MEREVELQFSNEVLYEAARRFKISENSLKLIGDFENYVYEGEIDGTNYILRLTHSSHRDTNMVLGELEWINYLAQNDISVAKAFHSINGELAEEIYVGKNYFVASLFEKAKGGSLNRNNPQDPTREVIIEWGRVIGKMHKATKQFEPSNEKYRRPQWFEDDLLCFEKYLLKEDEHIINIGNSLLEYASNLPKSKDCYGLIHTDVHSGNFFVDGGKIKVFDFDDCSYQWFASDIAIALYYTIWWKCNDDKQTDKDIYAKEFLEAFMVGYNEENLLEDYWLNEIPFFLKLRDITLYTVFHKKFDVKNMDEKYIKLLSDIKKRIESDTPIAEIGDGQ